MCLKARECIEKLFPISTENTAEEAKIQLGVEEVVKLNSNENPLGPSKKAVKAMQDALSQVHLYPDGKNTNLKQTLSRHLNVNPGKIFLGNGSDEIIRLLAAAFVDPGDHVHVFDPSLLEYHSAAYLMSGKLIKVPLDDKMSCSLKKMLETITEKTRLIYISNPHHPTGTTFTQKEFERFMQWIPSHVIVVSDEAYIDYCKDKNCANGISLLNKHQNLVVLRTFSKLHALAGLRVGYAVSEKEIINALQRVREPFSVNSVAQAGAIASLKDKEHQEKSKKCAWRGLNFYYRTLPDLGLNYILSQANFILIDLGNRDDKLISRELFKEGILVRDGTSLGLKGYIRASIGLMHENYAFVSALNKILQNKLERRRLKNG